MLIFSSVICALTLTLNRVPHLSFFVYIEYGADGGGDNGGFTGIFIDGPFWDDRVRLFCVFLFCAVMQAFLVMALHCAELLVNVSRDENFWRAASMKKGTALSLSAIKVAVQSWEW